MKLNESNLLVEQVTPGQKIESLAIDEMYRIRGGMADGKVKTKEIDIYDTRDI